MNPNYPKVKIVPHNLGFEMYTEFGDSTFGVIAENLDQGMTVLRNAINDQLRLSQRRTERSSSQE